MKKILTSVFLVALTVGLVSGAAYALFSDEVQVNNLAITTGNADLKISVDGTNYSDSYTQGDWLAQNVYPGWQDDVSFWLKNESKSNIKLDLTTRLTAARGDWGSLADVLEVRIYTPGGPYDSHWQKLAWWNGANQNLDGILDPGSVRRLVMSLRVPVGATSPQIAEKWISTDWVINAEQEL